MPEERFYLQYNPVIGAWELWEREAHGHRHLASFYDGDERSSPLASEFLTYLNRKREGQHG